MPTCECVHEPSVIKTRVHHVEGATWSTEVPTEPGTYLRWPRQYPRPELLVVRDQVRADDDWDTLADIKQRDDVLWCRHDLPKSPWGDDE